MKTRIPVPGSERRMLPAAKVVGKIDPRQEIEITVLVRPRRAAGRNDASRIDPMELGARPPGQRRYLSREEFAAIRGADPDDLARIDAFAHEHNLTVLRASIPERTVKLAGALSDFMTAFRPQLKRY